MTRRTYLGQSIVVLMTAALTAGIVGCSSGSSGGGGPLGTGQGQGAPGTNGGGTQGGSASGTNSGASGQGPSSGASGGAPSQGPSTGPTAGGPSSTGPAPSTTSTAGMGGPPAQTGTTINAWNGPAATDLAAPTPDVGMQIETPDYNANDPSASLMITQPGQEIFLCYYITLSKDVQVGGFRSWMGAGTSHHFILYQIGGAGAPAGLGGGAANGTINSCPGASGTWIYGTSSPGEVVGMDMPTGVGFPFPSGTQLLLNMHFINTGTTVSHPKLKLNILYAKSVMYTAGVVTSFNSQISIPAASASGPGTQTVNGTCQVPAGSKFFQMATHTHKHGKIATIDFVSGGKTTPLVRTGAGQTYPADQVPGSGADYQHPGVAVWNEPNFLVTQASDSFAYSCSYENMDSQVVTVGTYAATNEMCMMMGYYFPVGAQSCN